MAGSGERKMATHSPETKTARVVRSAMDERISMRDSPPVQTTVTENALRAHLRTHNASVLAGSGMAVIFSLIGWAVFYGVAYWLTMFVLAVVHAGEGHVSSRFNDVFFATAGVLLLAARVQQWIVPHERVPDRRPPLVHVADFLLFVPRFTLSAWQNLSALAALRDEELRQAAGLLDQLRETGKIPLQQLAAQFPDERSRARIVDTLKVARLVDQITGRDFTWLHVSSLAPEVFRGMARRIAEPEDKFEKIQRAKVVERRDPPRRALDGPRGGKGSAR